jgi:hypothetical protein
MQQIRHGAESGALMGMMQSAVLVIVPWSAMFLIASSVGKTRHSFFPHRHPAHQIDPQSFGFVSGHDFTACGKSL